MRKLIPFVAVFLAGCANLPPAGTPERTAYDGCTSQVLREYTDSHYANDGALGLAVAGELGNRIFNPTQMKSTDINPAIEHCMAENGFPHFIAEN